jgi:hypothetical protein
MLCAATVTAQETNGAIVGTVKDATGASVAGATVTITDLDKKTVIRTLTTGDDGTFSAPQIPVGRYEVAIEAPNFKKYVENNVKIDVSQRRTVDVSLQAGRLEEVVTVEADPLQVELQTPTASNLISGTQVRELSLNNRNFIQLATLMPGVSSNLDDQVYVGTTNPEGQANVVSISVNGARSSSNTWAVDGADTTDRGSNLTIQTYPSVDAISEFKVNRSLFPAETGRSGGGQINVVTRSGSNEFHGTLYEFVRNERMNANSFFNNRNAPLGLDTNGKAKRAPFRYNDFGWTFGGPVYLPHFGEGGPALYNGKNRTFFFFSQEFRRDIRYPIFNASVPTVAMRQGIFPIDVCTQLSGTTCVSRSRDISRLINPVSQAYVSAFFAGLPEPTSNFSLFTAARNVSKFRQEILRLDHKFTNKLSGFYRFQHDNIPTLDAQALFSSGTPIPGVSTTETNSPGKTHAVRLTYAATPSVVIDGGYSFAYGAILSNVVGKINTAQTTIPLALPFQSARNRVPTLTGMGFTGITGFGPYDNFSNYHAGHANLSWISGKHSMKFGGVLSRNLKHENALGGNNEGLISGFPFTGEPGTGTNPATGAAFTTGQRRSIQQFAYFLLGTNATFTQNKFDLTADLRVKNAELYGQDEYRVRRNLTLYYGLRYSLYGQPTDGNNLLSNFDPSRFNPAQAPQVNSAGNIVPGTGNLLNGIIVNTTNTSLGGIPSPWGDKVAPTPRRNFAPRVGLAWDPFGKGRTSVRTGYGVYHDQLLLGVWEQNIGVNPPYQQQLVVTGTTLSNPTQGGTPPQAALTIRAVDPNFHQPYYQHWSLDVQHQLFRKTLVSAGYYGSRGTHLPGIVDINLLPPGKALNTTCLNSTGAPVPCQALSATTGLPVPFTSAASELILDQIRPYRGYRSINMIQTRFNSNYHSMQLSLQQRFTGGNQLGASYTLGHNLTDNQTDRSSAPQNPYDIRAEYGRAQLDRRHVLTVNAVYELPWYKKQEGFAGHLLGGWQLSGIGTYNSGIPLTVTTSNLDPAGIGFLGPSASGPRPNLICDPNAGAPHNVTTFFNTACFADVATGTLAVGNAPRGAVEGPSIKRVDFTLTKNIRFGESKRLQLRGEAFNIFNHTNFRTISTNVTATNYGQVTTTRDPRIIQLGVKFYF